MISNVNTAVCEGIAGIPVLVEADISNGLPQVNIVGLASTVVMESRERIKSAILNSGFEYPRRRVTVNLIPAGIRKNGTHLDLPIAVGILAAMGYVRNQELERTGVIGELSLQGDVYPVEGVLPMILGMARNGIRRVIVPEGNVRESSLARNLEIIGVQNLQETMDAVRGMMPKRELASCRTKGDKENREDCHKNGAEEPDFSDIRGQENAKRAMMIAAAGHHGMLMVGNPGCGKTMLAGRFSGILPDLTEEQIIDSTVIYSVAGMLDEAAGQVTKPPFRKPHHSIGRAGLLGGGLYPLPGEITLAHNGVLFLDELCEFERGTIEALRIPMEEGSITHFRRGSAYRFPCKFRLLMAANPCPCGFHGDPDKECRCTAAQIENYQRKLSGPLLDRTDILIRMEKVAYAELSRGADNAWSSHRMKEQVENALKFAREQGRMQYNGLLTDKEVQELALSPAAKQFLERAYSALHLSPRTYIKVQRVARTIADLEQSAVIEAEHISEAVSYRTSLAGMV